MYISNVHWKRQILLRGYLFALRMIDKIPLRGSEPRQARPFILVIHLEEKNASERRCYFEITEIFGCDHNPYCNRIIATRKQQQNNNGQAKAPTQEIVAEQKKILYNKMAQKVYEELVNAIICPPRVT